MDGHGSVALPPHPRRLLDPNLTHEHRDLLSQATFDQATVSPLVWWTSWGLGGDGSAWTDPQSVLKQLTSTLLPWYSQKHMSSRTSRKTATVMEPQSMLIHFPPLSSWLMSRF